MLGKFYVLATPIGNLEDISKRALDTLKSVDKIFCEDTRVTSKLLRYYDINTPLDSYHQHSNLKKREKILELLFQGKNIALVSDAGTPGISDPGNELVEYLVSAFSRTPAPYVLASHQGGSSLRANAVWSSNRPDSANAQNEMLNIIPIPGASVVTAAMSVCGFKAGSFVFAGYFPKRKQTKWIEKHFLLNETVCYLDTKYRLISNLEKLKSELGKRDVCVCRELTKIHEKIYRGEMGEVIDLLKNEDSRGEVVVVIGAPRRN